MTTTGGSLTAYQYTPSYMFDGNLFTDWISREPNGSFTSTFTKPILFYGLKITARSRVVNQGSYQNVCVYLDGVKNSCTTSNRITKSGEIISIYPTAVTQARAILIRFPDFAQVAELEIFYKDITDSRVFGLRVHFYSR